MDSELLAELAQKVAALSAQVSEIYETFQRLKPMIERYEQVTTANSLLKMRKAFKQ